MLAAGLLFGGGLSSDLAFAQDGEVGPGSEGGKPKVINLDDEEEGGDAQAEGGKKEQADPEPVVAGEMTEQFASAKRLFDKKNWSEASIELFKVVSGDSGDDPGNQQLAQYYLAISLYHLKFYQASYSIFSLVAENKNHLKFRETLLWLSKLATQLPEPADIIERVGQYSDSEIARFQNAQQMELYQQLNYLLGRFRYRKGDYEDAIRLFAKVKPTNRYYVQAQFFTGVSYVRKRKSVPAVKAFQRIIAAIDDGVEGVEDESRMLDLAYLSQARTYYSSSIKLDPETNAPNVNTQKLSAAVKYWNQIDVASEYWLDALFEESWAYFMAGDYPRALGNIHTIQSPYFPGSFYPEADILTAVIYFVNCNYESATTVVARFNKRYVPIKQELEKVLTRFKGKEQEEPFYKFLLKVRDGTADLSPTIRGIVEASLSDRQLLRHIEYVELLDDEMGRYRKAPSRFRASGAGTQVEGILNIARQQAIKATGDLARQRYQRNLVALDEHLRNGEKILVDITAASRNLLDEELQQGQVSAAESKIYGVVKPDSEHVLWPFNGEFWRDELGFYRQVVESACGR